MFNKFKSALYNVVGTFDLTNDSNTSITSGFPPPLELNGGSLSKQNSKNLKYPYTRPSFLQLNSEEEILVTADHAIRPIICPRNISNLPWNAGYAETVNAGKTKKNEDQATVYVGYLKKSIPNWVDVNSAEATSKCKKDSTIEKPLKNNPSNLLLNEGANEAAASSQDCSAPLDPESSIFGIDSNGQLNISLPYYYFAVFDGHAGWGAAVHAANELHHIIHGKLSESLDLILPETITSYQKENIQGPLWFMETVISAESAITGALEQSFWQMDQQIAQDRLKYQLSGGCTACVGLFILGKLFVSNAGDSRATMALSGKPYCMSNDFTPETENHRIRSIGATQPELLGGEFTHVEFLHRPLKRDLGKRALYRDHYMKGWGYKTVTADDLKYPLVSGEGKRSRVLATIGVTRGFGDHDLKALHCSLPIKPFLSPAPEILVYDLSTKIKEDDCLLLGTDGLWDITTNTRAAISINDSLKTFPSSDVRHMYRYTSAAQDLVVLSRGKFKDYNWRTSDDKYATIDDITVFAIPLYHYKQEWATWKKKYANLVDTTMVSVTVPYEMSETKSPEIAADALALEENMDVSPVGEKTTVDLQNGSTEDEDVLKNEDVLQNEEISSVNNTTEVI